MHIDGQQYFIGVVLDISRKATAVKEGVILIALVCCPSVGSEQYHCKNLDPLPLFRVVYVRM